MKLSVIVVTYQRPDCVRRCLECLMNQSRHPDEVIVVDASNDRLTAEVVAGFAEVIYLRNESGFGRMTASRNIGLLHASGDIIAFVDDDAFAEPGWAEAIVAGYSEDAVGAVGGRALNRRPGEAEIGRDQVGKVLANGVHTGHFAADPGRMIDVDHIMGCNMSFRRGVLAELGGFREDYPGISGVREDTDMSLRVAALGYRLVFNPAAVVDHIGAPQAKGRRFDWRYTFYSARNHVVMLGRNYGIGSGRFWRFMVWQLIDAMRQFMRKLAGAAVQNFAVIAGLVLGFGSLIRLLAKGGREPARNDPKADQIRERLGRSYEVAQSELSQREEIAS